ncbi:hypothetical protein BDQ94DRAFT_145095 [Aspergillus welwitschiae]|uniref:Uncharacterized protein n=1 Tax=Aspergillus welwitschiae TaxID=1341132 RepID=A0A3F3Q0R5_9EURO|nr:hypothetical protein BDQ94DRAFT_145095 [Aspergillus welwitschiae]RDH32823.1 hypothetical protein BDQ94DRAFT_145095 [Aspergillus welwitschiae]
MSCRKEGGKWSAPAAPPAFQFREIVSYSEAAEGGREPHLSSRSKSEGSNGTRLFGFAVPDILKVTSRCARGIPVCSLSPSSFFFRQIRTRLSTLQKLDQLFRIHRPSTPYNRRKIILDFLKSLLSFFCFCPFRLSQAILFNK